MRHETGGRGDDKDPRTIGRRARKGLGVGKLAAKVERAQKAKNISERGAGPAETLRQIGSAVFPEQPPGAHAITIRR
jgi:hypothetical protein